MSWNHTRTLLLVLASTLSFACETPPTDIQSDLAPAAEEEVSLADVSLERPEQDLKGPRGIYMPVAIPEEKPVGVKRAMVAGGPPLPIFMNRFGGTYTGGFDNSAENRSSVVGQGTATLGAYGGSDAQWQQVMDCVTEQFSRFNVYVTDVEPTEGDYVESVVGGHPSQVGLPNGVGGVAPIDNFQCNIISRAVVYTFTDNIGNNPQNVCEVVAQEVAHAFSLDHELLCEDPMTYLNGCGDKSFQDIDAQCGEFQQRACNCNRASHNSVQLLFEKLGPSDGTEPPPPPQDDGPPTVAVTYPLNGDVLPQDSTIQVVATATDDTRITSVELEWTNNNNGSTIPVSCPVNQQGVSCSVNGDTYTWTINVSDGTRAFRVTARDVVGNVVSTELVNISLGEVAGDTEAPVVAIVSPTVDGAERTPNSTIEVSATATDNVGVNSVELLWEFSGNAFGCPMNQQAISCEVQGDTYTWTINVGEGSRGFQVRARDGAGNETTSERRVIELVENPQPDPEPTTPDPTDPIDPIDPTNPTDPGSVQDDVFEDNDSFERAAQLACASAIDATIQVDDDDWYSVTVDENVAVSITAASTDGAPMHIAIADGPDNILLESNNDDAAKELDVTSESSQLHIRVRSPQEGNYRLVITCEDALGGNRPSPTPEQSCSSAGGATAPAFLALALLALVRRRRS
jgi:MYXO-CTERM domain-containing protein